MSKKPLNHHVLLLHGPNGGHVRQIAGMDIKQELVNMLMKIEGDVR